MPAKTYVVACEVMKPELEALKTDDLELLYVEQSLHRTPQKMPEKIQARVDEVPPEAERVVLAYGLCSNGIEGVKAPAQGLYVPKAHDCIPLLLGSLKTYARLQESHLGTYWLSPGWLAEKQDPIGFMDDLYSARLGPEMAKKAIVLEMANYTHIGLINTGIGDLEYLRARTRENAEFLQKEILEVKGDDAYFRRIMHGPWDEEYFFYAEPGQSIDSMWWYGV